MKTAKKWGREGDGTYGRGICDEAKNSKPVGKMISSSGKQAKKA